MLPLAQLQIRVRSQLFQDYFTNIIYLQLSIVVLQMERKVKNHRYSTWISKEVTLKKCRMRYIYRDQRSITPHKKIRRNTEEERSERSSVNRFLRILY